MNADKQHNALEVIKKEQLKRRGARQLHIIRAFAGGLNAEPPFIAEKYKHRRTYAMIAAYASR